MKLENTIVICIASVFIAGFMGLFGESYINFKKLEMEKNCWSIDFLQPYVYLRKNTCTGEWSEEISKAGKELYEKYQVKQKNKNQM